MNAKLVIGGLSSRVVYKTHVTVEMFKVSYLNYAIQN